MSALAWALVGDEVIRILLTDAFLPVHRSATIILICVLFYCGAESCNILLYVEGRPAAAAANTVIYAAITVAGVFLALGEASAGTASRVAAVYMVSSLVYFVCSYLMLGFGARMWLPLRRTLWLALPVSAAVVGFVGEPSSALRLAAGVGLVLAYAGFALASGLLPRRELRAILTQVRHSLRGRDPEPEINLAP
ncbi:MAG: hypothetical protein GY856_43225 [bacterium]|nr:hypothetical protein [bacterium]